MFRNAGVLSWRLQIDEVGFGILVEFSQATLAAKSDLPALVVSGDPYFDRFFRSNRAKIIEGCGSARGNEDPQNE